MRLYRESIHLSIYADKLAETPSTALEGSSASAKAESQKRESQDEQKEGSAPKRPHVQEVTNMTLKEQVRYLVDQ